MLIGDHRIEIVPDTEFRLDGGAMFGVVPRIVWERVMPPDEVNRVTLNMNCVFIDTGREKVLIETGIGEKWSEKEIGMYGIFRQRPFADSLFEATGSKPEEIDIVINTHLHFDHAGGNTVSDSAGRAVPQFKNARYLVSASELAHARSPHERDRASYLPVNWEPMAESGQLEPMPDHYQPIPGLLIEQARGHSETMQTWRLDSDGRTVFGFADLIPTRHHLAPAWIMGYDLYPAETLEFKKRVLPEAVREKWLCVFYHDAEHPVSVLNVEQGKIIAEPVEM